MVAGSAPQRISYPRGSSRCLVRLRCHDAECFLPSAVLERAAWSSRDANISVGFLCAVVESLVKNRVDAGVIPTIGVAVFRHRIQLASNLVGRFAAPHRDLAVFVPLAALPFCRGLQPFAQRLCTNGYAMAAWVERMSYSLLRNFNRIESVSRGP